MKILKVVTQTKRDNLRDENRTAICQAKTVIWFEKVFFPKEMYLLYGNQKYVVWPDCLQNLVVISFFRST